MDGAFSDEENTWLGAEVSPAKGVKAVVSVLLRPEPGVWGALLFLADLEIAAWISEASVCAPSLLEEIFNDWVRRVSTVRAENVPFPNEDVVEYCVGID